MDEIRCPYCKKDLTMDTAIVKVKTTENYASIIDEKIVNISYAETINSYFICSNCKYELTGHLNDLCDNQIIVDDTNSSWG